ncbi:unnamed protein product [Prunus armeniaca]|uniref:Isoamylase 1-3-like C-terminal domain-containing protein n=1 Tax=Prunus armeniaca TaxID=36596 RepID=A0A6J5WCZ7_PRUAR|nr:unnamed protein product [Prunus armeniaca]
MALIVTVASPVLGQWVSPGCVKHRNATVLTVSGNQKSIKTMSNDCLVPYLLFRTIAGMGAFNVFDVFTICDYSDEAPPTVRDQSIMETLFRQSISPCFLVNFIGIFFKELFEVTSMAIRKKFSDDLAQNAKSPLASEPVLIQDIVCSCFGTFSVNPFSLYGECTALKYYMLCKLQRERTFLYLHVGVWCKARGGSARHYNLFYFVALSSTCPHENLAGLVQYYCSYLSSLYLFAPVSMLFMKSIFCQEGLKGGWWEVEFFFGRNVTRQNDSFLSLIKYQLSFFVSSSLSALSLFLGNWQDNLLMAWSSHDNENYIFYGLPRRAMFSRLSCCVMGHRRRPVIYEMNVRAIRLLNSMIPHLQELGINAVELLPVFELMSLSFRGDQNPRDHMVYYAGPKHTMANYWNFSGCGNTLNCNHPVVMELIVHIKLHTSSFVTHFQVTEYHVDGFRFDLASVLCRGSDGSPLSAPPLLGGHGYDTLPAIAKDSILSRCKIISEPWDCGGLYLVGRFPNWDRWAEWNGKYRDDLRRFIKEVFATRVSGSADLYKVNKRKPYHSVNFVIAHDGFTLYDLVSYNFKHNDANGEGGNDGSNDNLSWNCGYEGETDDSTVKAIRSRQMKNFHLALMISQGTPMMLMGDEYGHSRNGNNNSYGHDAAINHFQWGLLEARNSNHFRFFKEVIKFRQTHRVFGRDTFLEKNDVTWHEDNWHNYESKFLAFTFHDNNGGDVYMAFNAHDYFIKVPIPAAPVKRRWFRVVDTNLESPNDFVLDGVPGVKAHITWPPTPQFFLKQNDDITSEAAFFRWLGLSGR